MLCAGPLGQLSLAELASTFEVWLQTGHPTAVTYDHFLARTQVLVGRRVVQRARAKLARGHVRWQISEQELVEEVAHRLLHELWGCSIGEDGAVLSVVRRALDLVDVLERTELVSHGCSPARGDSHAGARLARQAMAAFCQRVGVAGDCLQERLLRAVCAAAPLHSAAILPLVARRLPTEQLATVVNARAASIRAVRGLSRRAGLSRGVLAAIYGGDGLLQCFRQWITEEWSGSHRMVLTQAAAYALTSLPPPDGSADELALWRELTRDDAGSITTEDLTALALEFGFGDPTSLARWFVERAGDACAQVVTQVTGGCPVCVHGEPLLVELRLDEIEQVLDDISCGVLAPACGRHDHALRARLGKAG